MAEAINDNNIDEGWVEAAAGTATDDRSIESFFETPAEEQPAETETEATTSKTEPEVEADPEENFLTRDTKTLDKYLVKGEDGAINYEESYKKAVEGYDNLRKMSTSSKAPKDISEYGWTAEETGWDQGALDSFLKTAQEADLSVKQVEKMRSFFDAQIQADQQSYEVNQQTQTLQALQTAWGKEFNQKARGAEEALRKFGLDVEDPSVKYNVPLITVMAALAPSLREDRTVKTADAEVPDISEAELNKLAATDLAGFFEKTKGMW